MSIAFDDAAADGLMRAAGDAAAVLRGQGVARDGLVVHVLKDFSGGFARLFTGVCVVEAEDRGRLAGELEDLVEVVWLVKRKAGEERERLAKLAAWRVREQERQRLRGLDLMGAGVGGGDPFGAYDRMPSEYPCVPPEVSAVFQALRRLRVLGGGVSGRSSADPARLRVFVAEAAVLTAALEDVFGVLRDAWAVFVGSCSWARLGAVTFLDGFAEFLEENRADVRWVEGVAAAFEDAGGGSGGAGGGRVLAAVPDFVLGSAATLRTDADYLAGVLNGMTPVQRAEYLAGGGFRRWAAAHPEGAKAALDAAADSGLIAKDSVAYRDFLSGYWNNRAMAGAGIDPAKWDTSRGTDENWDTISRVYGYYGELFLENPDLQWAGMANMIGPSFAGGFKDLEQIRGIARHMQRFPPAGSSPEQREVVRALAGLSDEELRFYETAMLDMNKEIFLDQARQHEAFRVGGIAEIRRLAESKAIDPKAAAAWELIAAGTPEGIAKGNEMLLRREQNEIIDDDYDAMRNRPVSGMVVTDLITRVGEASIPGTKGFPEVFAEGNISIKEHRWKLIEKDTLPAYQDLLRNDPGRVREIVGSDFDKRTEQARLTRDIPRVVWRYLRGFTGKAKP